MYELAEIAPERVHPVVEMSNAGRTNIALKNKKFIPKKETLFLHPNCLERGREGISGITMVVQTIFADKQPQDKALLDQLIAGTNKTDFILLMASGLRRI